MRDIFRVLRPARKVKSGSNPTIATTAHILAPAHDPTTSISHLGVELITDPQDAQFDICFVHGLTGNRRSTWTYRHKSTEVFWPKLLGDHYPTARIMTYGYDADVVGMFRGTSVNTLRDYGSKLATQICHVRLGAARRPIYFIAHSLGGLLVKQALLVCLEGYDQPQRRNLLESTSGILFFGTPHNGASIASWGHAFTRILSVMGWRIHHDIVATLKKNSKVRGILNEMFQGYLNAEFRHIAICCFHESIKMRLVGFVVDPNSASIDTKMRLSINADHSRMTKFVGPQDEGFRLVIGQLDSWMSEAASSNNTALAGNPLADAPPADTTPAATPQKDTTRANTPPAETPPAETQAATTPTAETPAADTPSAVSDRTPTPDAEERRRKDRKGQGLSRNPGLTQRSQGHGVNISIGGDVSCHAQVGYYNTMTNGYSTNDREARVLRIPVN